jgi:hypothetical protein
LSATAVAGATRSGDLDFSANLSMTTKPERLLKAIAFGATSAMVSANGRLKWEQGAPTEETWVPADISVGIWTPAGDPATTWTEK